MICQKCGKELDNEFRVCPYCGNLLQPVVENQQIQQSQQSGTYSVGNQPQSGEYHYGNQSQYAASQTGKTSTIGILALILGITGLLLSCFPVGIFPAIAGIVLGIIGIVKNNGRGMSIAGLVCGVVGVIIAFTMIDSDSTDVGETSGTQSTETVAEQRTEEQGNKSVETQMNEETKQDTEKTGEKPRKEFIDSCQKFEYKKIARNPDDYIGQNFKVTVQIFSKSEDSLFTDAYMKAYTDDGSGTYFDKMIYVFDEQDENSPDYVNVLENDIITVYGTFEGMEETKNVLNGEKSKDVALHMKYAKLVSEGE